MQENGNGSDPARRVAIYVRVSTSLQVDRDSLPMHEEGTRRVFQPRPGFKISVLTQHPRITENG